MNTENTTQLNPPAETVADVVVALGEEFGRAVAVWQAGAATAVAAKRIQDKMDTLLRSILSLPATSLAGAAVQVRAMSDFATYVGDARTVPGDESLFMRALQSICAVLDRNLGVERARWGGEYLLTASLDPHSV